MLIHTWYEKSTPNAIVLWVAMPQVFPRQRGFDKIMFALGLWLIHLDWVHLDWFGIFVIYEGVKTSLSLSKKLLITYYQSDDHMFIEGNVTFLWW